eukprot:tig00021181_g19320.t1
MLGLTKFLKRIASEEEETSGDRAEDSEDLNDEDPNAPAVDIQNYFASVREVDAMEKMRALRGLKDGTGVDYNAYATEEILLRCLRARKYDVDRATQLFENLARWLHEMGAPSGAPCWDLFSARALEPHLRLQFARLTGARDREGRPILNLDNGKNSPHLSVSQPKDYIRVLYYLVDVALRSPEAQGKGVVVLHDMSDLTLSKLDPRLPRRILGCIQNRFPMRVAKVLIYRPPWFFSLLFPIVRRFMKEKMRRRVEQVGDDPAALLQHVDAENLLPELGGRLQYDHNAWLAARIAEEP